MKEESHVAVRAGILIGVIAGLTPPAVLNWAARLRWLHLENTGLAILGYARTRYVLSVLAIVELVADKLPKTPEPQGPAEFCRPAGDRRVVWRGFRRRRPVADRGLLAGAVGSVVGTLGGHEFRVWLVKAIGGNDLPIALPEDVIAIGGALLIGHTMSG